jgi:tRNA U34 2-thiouridine synthase MnmA/TrmU
MRAIALISGGLDSILAARVIQEQGVEVIPLHFQIPFCHKAKDASRQSRLVRENLGLDLRIFQLKQEFLEMLKKPRYGFGSNMNPCIDCKILMLSKAKSLMQETGAQFIVTGEVLGQRPMSQHRQALMIIAKRSGLEGLVVRPLCARNLPETTPEKEGWVNREGLLDIKGRTRKPQLELAQKFKLQDYTQPSGGCLLTDPEFSRRLKELIAHQELSLGNIDLLKVGRHFRIAERSRLVVGRNEAEDNELLDLAEEGDYIFSPPETAGPTSLARGEIEKELIELSCRITARYCDKGADPKAKISYYRFPDKKEEIIQALALEESQIEELRV